MKKYIWLLSLLLLSSLAYAKEEDRISLSGYLKNESSIRINDWNGDLTKEKNIVELSGQYKINGDELVFFTKMKYWYDFAYTARDKYDAAQDQMAHVQRTDWLRDLYLDYTKGPWFLRLGKQQVAWGQADGIPVLDRVNPFDLTEYWLPDMVDIRIPLWMVNINYSPKVNSNLQVLIIPDFEQSTAAPYGAPFAFRSINEFEYYKQRQRALGVTVNTDIFYPGKQFKNSTFAVQWQDRIGDLEYTFNYLNGYYYSARTTLLGMVPGSKWDYGRIFKSWRMYGASFNKTFTNPSPVQGLTIRGDFAYYNDEPTYYGTVATNTTLGINRWDNIFWIMGLDKYLVTNFLASFQFGQYIMQKAKPGINTSAGLPTQTMNAYTYGPVDQVENVFSLKLSSKFMNDKLLPEILWSFGDDHQGRISPKINYEIVDNLVWTLGLHYFYGSQYDNNGQFKYENQFYTNLKFSF